MLIIEMPIMTLHCKYFIFQIKVHGILMPWSIPLYVGVVPGMCHCLLIAAYLLGSSLSQRRWREFCGGGGGGGGGADWWLRCVCPRRQTSKPDSQWTATHDTTHTHIACSSLRQRPRCSSDGNSSSSSSCSSSSSRLLDIPATHTLASVCEKEKRKTSHLPRRTHPLTSRWVALFSIAYY